MRKPTQSISDYEIYEIDRGTASPKERSRRLEVLRAAGTPYKTYRTRVSAELVNLSIEIKRMIDQKIMPILSTHLNTITDGRFDFIYSDVRVYPKSPQGSDFPDSDDGSEDDNLYILINIVVSIPKNDSLDSITREIILSFFQKEDSWTSSDKNVSKLKKKIKLFDLLNVNVISTLLNQLPYTGYDSGEHPGFKLEIDCDGIIETKFTQLKSLALGPELLSKRTDCVKAPLKLNKISIGNVRKEVPILLAKILDALGIKNIAPTKLKKSDNLYALCGYHNQICLSLVRSFMLHLDVLMVMGDNDIVTVGDAIDFAKDTLRMREND